MDKKEKKRLYNLNYRNKQKALLEQAQNTLKPTEDIPQDNTQETPETPNEDFFFAKKKPKQKEPIPVVIVQQSNTWKDKAKDAGISIIFSSLASLLAIGLRSYSGMRSEKPLAQQQNTQQQQPINISNMLDGQGNFF